MKGKEIKMRNDGDFFEVQSEELSQGREMNVCVCFEVDSGE